MIGIRTVGERLLVWANKRDAGQLGFGDDGQNAVAEIIREGEEPSQQRQE